MKITFNIEYRTQWGQQVYFNIDGKSRQPMETTDGVTWTTTASITAPTYYYYTVECADKTLRREWRVMPHFVDKTSDKTRRDYWVEDPLDGMSSIRLAGTLIPVFSLRSKTSFGVGDFGDLQKMIAWVAKTGMRVLQVLPINDTTTATHTWRDSYPYSCVSVFALHPQYADLNQLPAIKDKALRKEMETLRKELNALPEIDYERVNEAKMRYLQAIYEQEGKKVLEDKDYKRFYKEHKFWLETYAQFCCERDNRDDAAFYCYVQYVLCRQMEAAHECARRAGIILKGDIPIGVNRNGCDVKQDPHLFNLDGQAGAPPDDFAEEGQNWGFPTYNWDAMMQDGCQWWVNRFRNMSHYFDAYRIDHVLGFFRIWEIPTAYKSGLKGQFSPALALTPEEVESWGTKFHPELFLPDHRREGMYHPRISAFKETFFKTLSDHEQNVFALIYQDYFYRRNNQFWYEQAMQKLPRLVEATDMLVCAEDLGMVPACVPWVMEQLRILSLEVMSMPKAEGARFGRPEQNPYLSVCTLSSHDMPTLRQWWDEDYERAQDYYNNYLHHEGPAPHPMPGWLAEEILRGQLASPSVLCIQLLMDWLAMDETLRNKNQDAERINIPANPEHYWRYRMHLSVEQLMAADAFNDKIKSLVSQYR
ncbi:MAG: 4-alpha-glucanotransferase [Bacteroidaceae bacterium]|nr:4-alpha-glucanotransferase [Bacteroidaceae bacterium]